MKKRLLHRFTLAMALIMTGFFGFPGLAMAHQASISTTGPDSYNKIAFENSDKCKVENNNDVSVKNINFQTAQTGDAVVGSSWGAYAPEAWQARGASYEEWHAAVSAHMAEYQSKWGKHGGGNTVGGNATSGNASNVNHTSTNVNIDNSGACAEFILIDTNGDGKPDKKVQKKPGHVLGSTSTTPGHGEAGAGAGGHALGAHFGGAGGVGGQGGAGGAFSPTTSGSAGGPSGGAGPSSSQFSISKTGPDSVNKISAENENKVNIENNNHVSVVNVSKQSASSGGASVAGNTSGGGAGSGGASNANNSQTGAGVHN
jgi:hypothetical protein